MTCVVGVLCREGVVLGTDSSAMFTAPQVATVEQPFEKLVVIADCIIIAGTGEIGLGQRFTRIVDKAWKENIFHKSEMDIALYLSKQTIEDFIATHVPKESYGALVAFPASGKTHLCEFSLSSFQPEFKTELLWYCSMGSTQLITDPFLALMRDIFWQNGLPSLQDGVFATTWALDHAIAVNPGGVNGPARIAVLTTDPQYANKKQPCRARLLNDQELYEHRQCIDDAKKLLREFRNRYRTPELNEVPPVPQP